MTEWCADCTAMVDVTDTWMCSDGNLRCGKHRQQFAGKQVNGKDKATASAIAALHVGNDRLRDMCERQVIEALATVRREAKEEAGQIAFAEAVRQGVNAERAIAIKSKIERAAESREGGDDGTDIRRL